MTAGLPQQLIISVWNKSRHTCAFWRFTPFTGALIAMDIELERPVVHMQLVTAAENEPFVPQMVVLTDREMYVFPCSDVGSGDESEDGELQISRLKLQKPSDRVTCMTAHFATDHGLVIMTGTLTGRVDVWRLSEETEGDDDSLDIVRLCEISAPAKKVPVTHMHFEPLDKTTRRTAKLFLAQSEIQSESWRDLTKPRLAVVNLDAAYSSAKVTLDAEFLDASLGQALSMKVYRGSWLRLGFRVGISSPQRLTIVHHPRFQNRVVFGCFSYAKHTGLTAARAWSCPSFPSPANLLRLST